jgi:hypothetical protein
MNKTNPLVDFAATIKRTFLPFFAVVVCLPLTAGMCNKDDKLSPPLEGKGKITFGTETYIMQNASVVTGPGGNDYQLTVESTQTDNTRVGIVFRFGHRPRAGETLTIKNGVLGTDLSPIYWYKVNSSNTNFISKKFGAIGETMRVDTLKAGGIVVYFNGLSEINTTTGAAISTPQATGYIGE